jgi:hypothetical protein
MCAAVVDERGCIAEFLEKVSLFIGGDDSLLLFCFVLENPIGASVFCPNTAILSHSIPSLRLCVVYLPSKPKRIPVYQKFN